MIVFKIHCPHKKVTNEWRDKFCEALVGSPAFINSEIAVCDDNEYNFVLIVGESNDHDMTFDINESNLVSWDN